MESAEARTEPLGDRFDGLHAEAEAAVDRGSETIRSVTERYRAAYAEALGRWHALGDADEADAQTRDLGARRDELTRLELAGQSLERIRQFLERGDATLVTDAAAIPGAGPTRTPSPVEVRMRIVEAQEFERSRLAQEVHDGPAQALSNAIFQVDYVERVLATDPSLASTELHYLRDLLRRELGDVRAFISLLRPPVLDRLGLDEAILDAAEHLRDLTGLDVVTDLRAPTDRLPDGVKATVLRVAQEALQNIGKHASASHVTVTTRVDDDDWVLEVRDDGRGFDVGAVAVRGRRNFGLPFMRERADLIGARFDVRSRPDGGTVVRLAIPAGDLTGGKEST